MSLLRRPKLLLARVRTRLAPPVALPLAAVFLLFSVAGCLSTNVNVRSSGEQGGGVLVRVFADADAAKAGRTETSGTKRQ